MNTDPCRHCDRKVRIQARGLCYRCYDDRQIREQYTTMRDMEGREPDLTYEQLTALVAERMKKLPSWWNKREGHIR